MKAKPPLHRAKRRAARLSLYTSLVITILVLAAVSTGLRSLDTGPIDLGWRPSVPFAELEEVQLLQDYLRIDTTPQTGSELAGAEYLASVLEREGIPVEVIDMGQRKANLIAVLEGEIDEPLILHNHIDIDPVPDPSAWAHPPFSGFIDGPWIYGRGAFDMKSIAIAQLYALLQVKRSGVTPRRSVVFLATSSEETGSLLGTAWLLRERPNVLGRPWGALTEGGVVEARAIDDIKYWGTENAQKRYLRVQVCSPSRERLETLILDLRSKGQPLERLRLTPPVDEFLGYYSQTRDDAATRELLSQPEAVLHDLARFAKLASYQRSLFRDEITNFPIERALGGRAWSTTLTLLLLPDADPEQAIAELLPDWILHGTTEVLVADTGPGTSSPLDHPIFTTIGTLVEERFGHPPNGPYFQTRSTNDSRLFRAQGIPSYGFSPFVVLPTDTFGVGGSNETLALPAYVDGVALYVELVRRLTLG